MTDVWKIIGVSVLCASMVVIVFALGVNIGSREGITFPSSPTPTVEAFAEQPDAPRPTVSQQQRVQPTTEATLPVAQVSSPSEYIDCMMTAPRKLKLEFEGESIQAAGNSYDISDFYPVFDVVLARDACQGLLPTAPLSERPNCIRQALSRVLRDYGSDHDHLIGVIAVDLCRTLEGR